MGRKKKKEQNEGGSGRRWLTEAPPDGPLLGFVLYPELGYPYTTEYLGLKTTFKYSGCLNNTSSVWTARKQKVHLVYFDVSLGRSQ